MRKIAYLILALAAGCVYSCSTNKGSSPTSGDVAENGNVSLPLVATTADGTTYRLDNASFRFTGPVTETISAPAEATALQVRLPAGTYSVQLLDGWQLSQLLASGAALHVNAVVAGSNPITLVVTTGGTSEALFQLQLASEGTQLGTGRVRFEVIPATCVPKGVSDCRLANIDCGPMSDGCGGTVTCGACLTGQTCSAAGKCVCPAPTCSALGAECGTATDVCGGTVNCGTCATGKVCNSSNKCIDSCVPTTCAVLDRQCGPASDGCGVTLDCGTCPTGQACNASGKCIAICTPLTSCGTLQCGSISDGCGGTIACGSCGVGQICNAANMCEPAPCTPKTCAELAVQCGPASDGCGGTLACGTCPTGQTCNSAGACVCQPTTCAAAGAQCGSISDGCGATLNCGSCATGQTCNATNQCQCVPRTCASAGATCGSISDGCGGTLSCGTCPTGQACNATNTCACVPTTCSALGITCGSASNGCGGTLTCGTCPTGQTCSASGTCQAAAQIVVTEPPTQNNGSPWPGGYCVNYTVANKATTATKNWNVVLNLKGATVNSVWNATRTTVSAGNQFTAASYNAVIPASGTTTFGYCVTFTGTYASVAPAVVSASGTY